MTRETTGDSILSPEGWHVLRQDFNPFGIDLIRPGLISECRLTFEKMKVSTSPESAAVFSGN